jgi:hypothetical protein
MKKLITLILFIPLIASAQWDATSSSSIFFKEDASAQGGDVGIADSTFIGWNGTTFQTIFDTLGRVSKYAGSSIPDNYIFTGVSGKGAFVAPTFVEYADFSATSPLSYNAGTGTFSLPITANQIPYGTGTSIGSEAAFTYDASNNHFSILGNWAAFGGPNTENFNFHVEEDARVEGVFSGYSSSKTVLAIRRANGTSASPTPILNTEIIGDLSFGGYKSTAWSTSSVAAIQAVATETFDDTGTGTALNFQTTPNNTTGVVTQVQLDQDGTIAIEKTIDEYNNITLVNHGVPYQVAEFNVMARASGYTETTLYTAPADGFYRISFTAKVTTPASSSSILGPFQYKFTEADDAVTVTAPPGNTNNVNQTNANSTTTGYISGSYIIHADAGTDIKYIMGYTSSGVTAMQYNFHVILEALGN